MHADSSGGCHCDLGELLGSPQVNTSEIVIKEVWGLAKSPNSPLRYRLVCPSSADHATVEGILHAAIRSSCLPDDVALHDLAIVESRLDAARLEGRDSDWRKIISPLAEKVALPESKEGVTPDFYWWHLLYRSLYHGKRELHAKMLTLRPTPPRTETWDYVLVIYADYFVIRIDSRPRRTGEVGNIFLVMP